MGMSGDPFTLGGGRVVIIVDSIRLEGKGDRISANGIPLRIDSSITKNGGSGGFVYIKTFNKLAKNSADLAAMISANGGFGVSNGLGGAGGLVVLDNFYLTDNAQAQPPKTWANHHIYNNSMILCIGGTGAGKSNALLNYLSRAAGEFYKIIICSFSTTDEPLYQLIKKNNKDVELINNIDDVLDLHSFDDKFKDKPKIIVFDDFINLSPKEMVKINEYLISGRKFGFSVWLMAQNYTSVQKIISRNVNYFILFKLNDNASIDRIIRNHNVNNIKKEVFKKYY
jgi:hypothetical protein